MSTAHARSDIRNRNPVFLLAVQWLVGSSLAAAAGWWQVQ